MGAVWPRANAPDGSMSRTWAWKLSVVRSFIVAIAITRTTFPGISTRLVQLVCSFFITRRKHITSAAYLSSGGAQTFGGCFGAAAGIPVRLRAFRIAHPNAKQHTPSSVGVRG